MRQWVTPRSLALHAAFLVVASGCLVAGWWQVQRAMAGNTLSYLYSIEWPAFAVVAGIGWWQMFHDTPEDIAARKAHHARMRAASAAVVARTLPRAALAITVGSEEVRASPALPPRAMADHQGSSPASRRLPSAGDRPGGLLDLLPVADGTGWDDGPSAGGRAEGRLEGSAECENEMSAYNRYLALLAVRGRAKTWRNPRGL